MSFVSMFGTKLYAQSTLFFSKQNLAEILLQKAGALLVFIKGGLSVGFSPPPFEEEKVISRIFIHSGVDRKEEKKMRND